MSSYLDSEPKDAFTVLKLVPRTLNVNPDPRGKTIQKCKILSVSRNCDLSLKLDCLPRKTSFSIEAHFRILRPLQDSWRRNESVGIFASRFWVSVTPARKLRQQLKYQFWSRKVCFQNFTKHSNIYISTRSFRHDS